MIKDFIKLLFLIAIVYAGWQLFSTGRISNPFSGKASAFSSAKSREISTGERVELAAHTAKEGVTLFYFTSRWSRPCRAFAPQLGQYAASKNGVSLRRIDVGSSSSPTPVAIQYGIKAVPQVWVSDSRGRIAARVTQPSIQAVDQAVKPLLAATRRP